MKVDVLQKKFVEVNGVKMAYYEEGEGDPIVFLHGNPTSSYLWRNVIPHVRDLGRCIAPDLIGMGDSDKLENSGPNRYTFVEHRQYLNGLFETLGVNENVTLVIHDWGSALGFDWACRNRDSVKGIAYMESITQSVADWEHWPEGALVAREFFQGFRSPAGEEMILTNNMFVEGVMPAAVLRTLSDEEMNEYRRPFANAGEDRRPTLSWPRQVPIGGQPAEVARIVENYGNWMAENELPKLFINAEPGVILTALPRDFCRTWKNQTEVTVAGLHYIQEDSPDEIGQALRDWYAGI
jgi:haloalkane dehalogenase